jgi:hypothetical protein
VYKVTYIREPWSTGYEIECPADGVMGEFTWAELQDNFTNGNHGSGWMPGRYRVELEFNGEREATFDVIIGAPPLTLEDAAHRAAASE